MTATGPNLVPRSIQWTAVIRPTRTLGLAELSKFQLGSHSSKTVTRQRQLLHWCRSVKLDKGLHRFQTYRHLSGMKSWKQTKPTLVVQSLKITQWSRLEVRKYSQPNGQYSTVQFFMGTAWAQFGHEMGTKQKGLNYVSPYCCDLPRAYWLREKDLNLRPLGYEPNELPDCSIAR